MSREMPVPGIYRGYLNPIVYQRLVNYYATDPVYLAVRDILGYLESVKWYDSVSETTYEIIKRSQEIMDTADALAGKIIGDYFERVSDLVSRHGNLMWFSDVDRVTDANELFSRRTNITGLTDFTMGTTPTGGSRWARFQNYLNDELYSGVQGLIEDRPTLDALADMKPDIDYLVSKKPQLTGISDRYIYIQGLIDGLRAQADEEGISFETIRDRMRWYSRGDVTSIINERINLRFGHYEVRGPDFVAVPSDRGTGGKMMVHEWGNILALNHEGFFEKTRLDGPLTHILGRFDLDGKLGGASWADIRDRLQEIQDTIQNSINTLGDRNTPGTTFGDLFALRQEYAAFNRTVSTPDLRNMCDVLLGIDNIVHTMDGIKDKINSIIRDHFTPW